MTAYNEQLVKAGIMLDGAGLRPSSAGAKVVLEGGTTSVVDGPFTEAKEIIGGYWIWQVSSLEEAIEWAKQCPSDPDGAAAILEIRPYARAEDFGEAYTPEIRTRGASPKRSSRHGGRLRTDRTEADGRAAYGRGGLADASPRASSPSLTRLVRDVGLAEELAQDAFVAALEQWPAEGVPDKPGRLADDDGAAPGDRPDPAGAARDEKYALARGGAPDADGADALDGDRRRPAGARSSSRATRCCRASRASALTLRLVGGLTTDEIARAFLVPSPTSGSGSRGPSARSPRRTSRSRCRGATSCPRGSARSWRSST